MISHEYEPPTPTKREMLEYDIQERQEQCDELEETIATAQETLDLIRLDLAELREELRRLDPDPDADRDEAEPA